jgi:hypothetical protein
MRVRASTGLTGEVGFAQPVAYWKRALKIEPDNAVLHRMLARADDKFAI